MEPLLELTLFRCVTPHNRGEVSTGLRSVLPVGGSGLRVSKMDKAKDCHPSGLRISAHATLRDGTITFGPMPNPSILVQVVVTHQDRADPVLRVNSPRVDPLPTG